MHDPGSTTSSKITQFIMIYKYRTASLGTTCQYLWRGHFMTFVLLAVAMGHALFELKLSTGVQASSDHQRYSRIYKMDTFQITVRSRH